MISRIGRIVFFSSKNDCTLCQVYCLCLLIVYNILIGYFGKMSDSEQSTWQVLSYYKKHRCESYIV